MIAEGRTQVFANVPIALKERLDALKEIDKVLYSHSRVTTECLAGWLGNVEQRAQSFKKPTYEAPAKRRRLARV